MKENTIDEKHAPAPSVASGCSGARDDASRLVGRRHPPDTPALTGSAAGDVDARSEQPFWDIINGLFVALYHQSERIEKLEDKVSELQRSR